MRENAVGIKISASVARTINILYPTIAIFR